MDFFAPLGVWAGELHSPHAAGVNLHILAVSLRVRVARRTGARGTPHGDAHSNGMGNSGLWSRQPNPRWCWTSSASAMAERVRGRRCRLIIRAGMPGLQGRSRWPRHRSIIIPRPGPLGNLRQKRAEPAGRAQRRAIQAGFSAMPDSPGFYFAATQRQELPSGKGSPH